MRTLWVMLLVAAFGISVGCNGGGDAVKPLPPPPAGSGPTDPQGMDAGDGADATDGATDGAGDDGSAAAG